jgi:hypothetical protein
MNYPEAMAAAEVVSSKLSRRFASVRHGESDPEEPRRG